jgi:hypothetical protein
MSKEKYDRILEDMCAVKVIDSAETQYNVMHMIDSDALKPERHYTMAVAHYIGRLQRKQPQGREI